MFQGIILCANILRAFKVIQSHSRCRKDADNYYIMLSSHSILFHIKARLAQWIERSARDLKGCGYESRCRQRCVLIGKVF